MTQSKKKNEEMRNFEVKKPREEDLHELVMKDFL